MTKIMKYFFPVMILWMARSYPAGLAIYWFGSQVIQIGYNFAFKAIRKRDLEKKKKAKVDKKTSGIWKVLGKLTDSVDKTFSTLYDGMEYESSNDRQ